LELELYREYAFTNSFVLGLFLGFPGIVIALYFAFVLGAIISIILLLLKLKKFGSSLPFGPFLILGTLTALFAGRFIYPFITQFLGF